MKCSMKNIFQSIKNLSFKKQNSLRRRKLFLWEAQNNKKIKKTYKKRKNIHFQTHLDFSGQKKILFYTYISIFILIISWVIFLFASNKFTIKNIEIVRQDNISNINLAYNAVNNFRWKSIFSVDKTKIIDRIYSYQNNINSVTINSSLPDTLIIYIGSAKQLFNTLMNEKTYIITGNWTVVPEKPNNELKTLSVVFRKSLPSIIDYKQILKPEAVVSIYNIVQQLEKNIIDLRVESISYLPIEREAHIYINSGTILIFDIHENIEDQIEKIAIFHNEKSPITQSWIVYIDVRVDKKIFLCNTDSQNTCIQNMKKIYWNE